MAGGAGATPNAQRTAAAKQMALATMGGGMLLMASIFTRGKWHSLGMLTAGCMVSGGGGRRGRTSGDERDGALGATCSHNSRRCMQ
jgi:hypothetical protein